LIDFVDSKHSFEEGHIHELRHSPLYLAGTLAQYIRHDSRAPKASKPALQMTPRAKGQPRTNVNGQTPPKQQHSSQATSDWNIVIQDVQYDAYLDYVLSRALQELLVKVRKHFDYVHQRIKKNRGIKMNASVARYQY
jgi:hypothetical protein